MKDNFKTSLRSGCLITQIIKQITWIVVDRDPLTERIIACCYRVHTELGPGFKEKIYHNALKLDFNQDGLKYETEKQFEVYYQYRKVGKLIVDLIVEDIVIVEVKALIGSFPDIFNIKCFLI